MLGVCERTFRRYIDRYEASELEGLIDRRLAQVSHRHALEDKVMALCERYQCRHMGWSAKHFYAWYWRESGARSYSWVKSQLQEGGLIKKVPGRDKHRKKRERSPWPGMMLHQDGTRSGRRPNTQIERGSKASRTTSANTLAASTRPNMKINAAMRLHHTIGSRANSIRAALIMVPKLTVPGSTPIPT